MVAMPTPGQFAQHVYNTFTKRWQPRQDHDDYGPELRHAIKEIESSYGVKVKLKNKTLHKFGRTTNADDGVKTTIATFQDNLASETYATGNTVDSISSSSTSDTGPVRLEGHYLDGQGRRIFHVQWPVLEGRSEVTLAQPLFRSTRIRREQDPNASPQIVLDDLVGNVYVYDSSVATTPSMGVPDDATATKVMISAGQQQSEKAATSLSYLDFWIVSDIHAFFDRTTGQGVTAAIEVEYRELNGVFTPLGLEMQLRSETLESDTDRPKTPYIIPPSSDVILVGTSDTANTIIGGYIHGVLATIQE